MITEVWNLEQKKENNKIWITPNYENILYQKKVTKEWTNSPETVNMYDLKSEASLQKQSEIIL